METFWIILLGAIQGATEFLPVSSSGHLALGQLLMTDSELAHSLAEQPMMLEVLLHLATLLAVVVFYRKDVLNAIKGFFRALKAGWSKQFSAHLQQDDGANLAIAVIVGTIPTGIIGLTMEEPAAYISQSSTSLGLTFLGCACLLLASRWWPGGKKRLTWKLALLIGIIQGIAVLPGISRSGSTIALALALGIDREEAAKFSFLLSLPAIAGAALLEVDTDQLASNEHLVAFGLGAIVAFVIGLAALMTLIKIVRGGRLWLFAPYVTAVGLFSIFAL